MISVIFQKFLLMNGHDIAENIANGPVYNFVKCVFLYCRNFLKVLVIVQLPFLSLRNISVTLHNLHHYQLEYRLTSLKGTETDFGPEFLNLVLYTRCPVHLIYFGFRDLRFLQDVMLVGQTDAFKLALIFLASSKSEQLSIFFPLDCSEYYFSSIFIAIHRVHGFN